MLATVPAAFITTFLSSDMSMLRRAVKRVGLLCPDVAVFLGTSSTYCRHRGCSTIVPSMWTTDSVNLGMCLLTHGGAHFSPRYRYDTDGTSKKLKNCKIKSAFDRKYNYFIDNIK